MIIYPPKEPISSRYSKFVVIVAVYQPPNYSTHVRLCACLAVCVGMCVSVCVSVSTITEKIMVLCHL